jgi:hypothetical protein
MGAGTCELGPSGPVSEMEVLAALARAELHARRWYPQLSDIAHHLGWRYSGAATRRLRPHLERLSAAGLVAAVEPPAYKMSSQKWVTTDAGRRRLASSPPVELPESPQHRRWRQDRDVAAWARDAARREAWVLIEELEDLLAGRPEARPILSEGWAYRASRRFEEAFRDYALATRMWEQWPEPSDLAADDAPADVSRLLPEIARKRRR